MSIKLKKDVVSAQMQVTNDVVGAWKTQILFTLNELGVFDALRAEPRAVAELSRQLGIPQDALSRVLNAAVAVGYLLKEGERYASPPFMQAVTDREADGYLGNWLRMYARWYTTFARLPEAIRKGGAIEDVNDHAGDEGYHEIFISGMKDYASYRGSDILNHLDLSREESLLDVGCGPGIYVGMFCEKYPRLHCTCYDVPAALKLAREHLGHKGVLERVSFRPGDYKADESFGEALYDVVFISHVLHQEDRATCAAILKKALRALKPGGQVVIQAMYLNDSETGPLYASFHDLLSLMVFPGGRNYTYRETMDLLTEAGFSEVRKKQMSYVNVNSLVLGRKGAV